MTSRKRNLTAEVLVQFPDDSAPYPGFTCGALGVSLILQRAAAFTQDGATVNVRIPQLDTTYTVDEYRNLPWIVEALANGDAA